MRCRFSRQDDAEVSPPGSIAVAGVGRRDIGME